MTSDPPKQADISQPIGTSHLCQLRKHPSVLNVCVALDAGKIINIGRIRAAAEFAVLFRMVAIWRATQNKTANSYIIEIAM